MEKKREEKASKIQTKTKQQDYMVGKKVPADLKINFMFYKLK